MKSASSFVTQYGGKILITFPGKPAFPIKAPNYNDFSKIWFTAFAGNGSLVYLSATNSIPIANPYPLTCPIIFLFCINFFIPSIILFPTTSQFSYNFSSSIIFNTARAPAQLTGLPPKVLKFNLDAKVFPIS